jgi:hypothetical protein
MEKTVNIRMRHMPERATVVEPIAEAKALCWTIIGMLVVINASIWYVYLT